jgi:hypothetical protein
VSVHPAAGCTAAARKTSTIPSRPEEERMSLEKLYAEIELLKGEYEKFERGNKSAGTRARKHLQEVKKIAQEIRVEIQNKKTEAPAQ